MGRCWRGRRHPISHLLGVLRPGLVTDAGDDDSSGICHLLLGGAQFGYGQLWTASWLAPLLIRVQEAGGRIGLVTGLGLACNTNNR